MSETDALTADYAQAGFGIGLELGRSPALLVIDMARAYFEAHAPLYLGADTASATLASVQRVIAAARTAHVPIVFTEVRFVPGGRDGGVFFRKVAALRCFEAGNPLGDLATGIELKPGDVTVTKQYASAFFATSLASTLTSMGVDTVIVTGVSTSGCVRATAVDACQHGFVPLVVRDACGDRSIAVHDANLFDLQQKYAEVRSEAEAVLYLERSGVAHDQP